MKHILLIDPLEKLVPKKDSTLLLAHTLKSRGIEVSLVFEKDFYFSNEESMELIVYDFSSSLIEGEFYLEKFEITKQERWEIDADITLHMRLDPPFDGRYLRYLWMLKGLQKKFKVQVVNSPEGILYNNEKMCAYELENSVSSFVGSSPEQFVAFTRKLKIEGNTDLILKPLDFFQGIGVEKLSLELSEEELRKLFEEKVEEYNGPVVAQPFLEEVAEGEIRSVYYAGEHLGSILKIPKEGEFLANIAQGATFHKVDLNPVQEKVCQEVAKELLDQGVPWIAYDILGNNIQEVNVTCPGLIVEVSKALGRNLADDIIDRF
jgi:glutathione synthase